MACWGEVASRSVQLWQGVEKIAEGHFTSVWKATPSCGNQTYVFKVTDVARFRENMGARHSALVVDSEATILRRCVHAHIIRIVDSFFEDQSFILVFDHYILNS